MAALLFSHLPLARNRWDRRDAGLLLPGPARRRPHHSGSLKGLVGDSEQALSELMWTTPTLADELSDGLEDLRKHKINVDKMPLKKVKARKR